MSIITARQLGPYRGSRRPKTGEKRFCREIRAKDTEKGKCKRRGRQSLHKKAERAHHGKGETPIEEAKALQKGKAARRKDYWRQRTRPRWKIWSSRISERTETWNVKRQRRT